MRATYHGTWLSLTRGRAATALLRPDAERCGPARAEPATFAYGYLRDSTAPRGGSTSS
jgi:hypothetical protein